MPKYYQLIFQTNTWLAWAKILSADLSDKDMIADKYLICDKNFIYNRFCIGDTLYWRSQIIERLYLFFCFSPQK